MGHLCRACFPWEMAVILAETSLGACGLSAHLLARPWPRVPGLMRRGPQTLQEDWGWQQCCVEPVRRSDHCHRHPYRSATGQGGRFVFGFGVGEVGWGGGRVVVGGRERRRLASKNQSAQDSRGSLGLRVESSSSLMWSTDENTFPCSFSSSFPSVSSFPPWGPPSAVRPKWQQLVAEREPSSRRAWKHDLSGAMRMTMTFSVLA